MIKKVSNFGNFGIGLKILKFQFFFFFRMSETITDTSFLKFNFPRSDYLGRGRNFLN